jgi:hypothetical protein
MTPKKGRAALKSVYAKAYLLVTDAVPDEDAKNKLAMLISYWQNLRQPSDIKTKSLAYAAVELTGRITQHGESVFYGVPIDLMVRALTHLADLLEKTEESNNKRKAKKSASAAPEEA